MTCADCGAQWRLLADEGTGTTPAVSLPARPGFARSADTAPTRDVGIALDLLRPHRSTATSRSWSMTRPLAVAALAALTGLALFYAPATWRTQPALAIHDIRVEPPPSGDRRAVTVTGTITNHSEDVLSVPDIRIAMDFDGARTRLWTHRPARRRLAAGASVRFRTSLASTHSQTPQISVTFDPTLSATGS